MADSLLLEGAALIDGLGGPPVRDAMVLIEGERIAYAGPRDGRFDGRPLERRGLAGKTIVPGLIEAHTHAAFDGDMRVYLKNGVTTIRFAGLDLPRVAALRARVEGGDLPGPRIVSCGPMIDQPPPAYPEWSVAVRTPAEARATVERLVRDNGVEYLLLTQRITLPVMRAAVEAAHGLGRTVFAQTWEVDGAEAAEAGIDELHTSSRVSMSAAYPKETLMRYGSIPERLALTARAWASVDWPATERIMDVMIARGVAYCGMQVIAQYQVGDGVEALEADPDFALFSEGEREAFRVFTRRVAGGWTPEDLSHARAGNEARLEWMRRFRERGGTLIAGTDTQFGGIMLHRELANLASFGMSPLEAIAAATGTAARMLRMDDRIGTVRAGRLADLVILNRDPTGDLGALRDIAAVFKGGTLAWSRDGAWG